MSGPGVLAVTLVRLRHGDKATYLAVPAVTALAAVATIAANYGDLLDARTLPWDTLPGIEHLAAAALGASGGPVCIGTTVNGEWVSWYPPGPQPPGPAQ
jgi:hypothetical protein